MVSYLCYYGWKFKDFHSWYLSWWQINCENCKHSGHNFEEENVGYCLAEQNEQILSKKRKLQAYIAIYYHKKMDKADCALKSALSK